MKYHHFSVSLIVAALPILLLSVLLYTQKTVPSLSKSTAQTTEWRLSTDTTTTATQTTPPTSATTETQSYPEPGFADAFSQYPLNENGIPHRYDQLLEGTACAYTAPDGAITATGTVPKVGTVAVNPDIIPFGSKLFITSDDGYVYGYAIAEDTGGDLLNNAILVDLYMDTYEACRSFGRQTVKIYVLE